MVGTSGQVRTIIGGVCTRINYLAWKRGAEL